MRTKNVFIRAFGEIIQLGKKAYALTLLNAIFERSIPFINIIYMSRVLSLLTQQEFEAVVNNIIQYLIIFGLFQIGSSLISPQMEQHLELLRREMMHRPYEKMIQMSFHYADQSDTHDKIHQINRDMYHNNSSMVSIAFKIRYLIEDCVSLIWVVILLAPLWTINEVSIVSNWDWVNRQWLNIILIFLIVIGVSLQVFLMRKVYQSLNETSEEVIERNALYYYLYMKLSDAESGKEIRLYNLLDATKKIIFNQAEAAINWERNYRHKEMSYSLVSNLLSQFLTLAIYAMVGIRVLLGSLPIELLIQLSGALNALISSLSRVITFFSIFSQTAPLERYYEIMDYPDETSQGSIHVEKRLDNDFQLSVDDLSFSYPESERTILKAINQVFVVGKKYAIVGENGSGKTTFIKLLMRLYEPSEGHVKLNTINANKYKLTEFYKLFSVVFQDYRLLSFKLGQNIAVNQQYDAELARQSLSHVELDDFVAGLPFDLETYLGNEFESEGVNLSGGQAQKVAMARALYKDAPIMILDEPTAALDPIAEFEIYQMFSQMTKEKTAFYISHRLSSCRFCDEILVFDKGEIVQRGSHEELLNEDGKYRQLWYAQAQYYQ